LLLEGLAVGVANLRVLEAPPSNEMNARRFTAGAFRTGTTLAGGVGLAHDV